MGCYLKHTAGHLVENTQGNSFYIGTIVTGACFEPDQIVALPCTYGDAGKQVVINAGESYTDEHCNTVQCDEHGGVAVSSMTFVCPAGQTMAPFSKGTGCKARCMH